VHGANRLASNSLLEGLVFGARAGMAAADYGLSRAEHAMQDVEFKKRKEKAGPDRSFSGRQKPNFDMEEIRHLLRKLMWERVGIIRCEESLSEARKKLEEWSFIEDRTFMTRRELELKNMYAVSKLITESAFLRKGSVGAHYRSDYPQIGDGWERHIVWKK
jgi:L-aspartate oxidase